MASITHLSDKALGDYCRQLNSVVEANSAVFQVTAEELTKMNTKTSDYETKNEGVIAAKGTYANAVEAKDMSREDLLDYYMKLIGRFQNTEGIPDNLKREAGLTVKDMQPTPLHPYEPKNLTAKAKSNGDVDLDWERGENKQGMQFVVELRKKDAVDFTMVDIVTATKYVHKGQTPGENQTYRIRARKGDSYSDPSNEATVY